MILDIYSNCGLFLGFFMADVIGWSDDFLLGIYSVDEQHKYLFELINSLKGCQKDELEYGLEQLFVYTQEHFCEEEKLMKLIKYPDYEQHRQLHQNLIAALTELSKSVLNDSSQQAEFESFLSRWLVNHIMTEDVKIKQW